MCDVNSSPESWLTKFILKQVIDGLVYDAEMRCIKLKTKTVTPRISDIVIKEAARYGFDPVNARRFLDRVVSEISGQCVPRVRTVQYLDCRKLDAADVEICLEGSEGDWGHASLNLLYLGRDRDSGRASFYVLHSDRHGLHPHDIIEPDDDRMWGISHPVFFRVFRDGRRYPSESRVYRTYKLTQIKLTQRGTAYEVVDSNSRFTFDEREGREKQSQGLTFGSNPASVLFHELYAPEAPVIAAFRDGVLHFRSNPDYVYKPSECRDEIFGLVNELRDSRLKLKTTTDGRMSVSEDGTLSLSAPANTIHEAL